MVTRRELMGTAMAFAWPRLDASASPAPVSALPAGAPDDETFWSAVRGRFELVPEAANLVTVVRGVCTKATRESTAAEAERFNAFRPRAQPAADWKGDVRKKAAAFIGAPPETVALVRNTTEGVTTVLLNWPLERGDEVLTSSAEHGQFYDTLAQRSARDGVAIRRFHYPAPATSLDAIVDAIDRAMTPRTRLVMIGHVVLTGQVNPVRAIADRVHARGAKLLVDGVLGIGHVETDVVAMDCDFYAAGFHKWGCGPRATAVFYVQPGLVERLPSLFGSGSTNERGEYVAGWSTGQMGKYESFGAHPEWQYHSLGDALDYLSTIGVSRIRPRLYRLSSRWVTRVQRLPRFRAPVRLDPAHCGGLVAWELAGVDHAPIRQVLRDRNILVGGTERYGGFFGIPESSPRSLFIANAGIFTSPADVDRLAEAIETAAAAMA
jgi:selenocysteine lyase/cysteine desulfurase